MIIEQSRIAMQGTHMFIKQEQEQESLHYWNDSDKKAQAEGAVKELTYRSAGIRISHESDRVSFSAESMKAAKKDESAKSAETAKLGDDELEKDIKDGWKLTLLRRLMEHLTGKPIKIFRPDEMKPAKEIEVPHPPAGEPGAAPAAEEREGWGLAYDYQRSYFESEQTRFSAQALVKTADGREISVNVELGMSRAFASQESVSLRAGDALKDPLVINFAGTSAELEPTDLRFDLDLDGTADDMKFVSYGSGFLALDKNGDGLINDGRELFGPSSGDGFAELAAYDEDGNQWIDENDSVFDRLRIWERDAAGNFSLLGLAQRDIGAISLQKASTPFALNDSANNTLGQVRTTGLFLRESGTAGTVQQLDLVV